MNGRTARYLAGASGFALALSLGSGVALADDSADYGVDLDYLTAEEKLAHDVYTTLGETWEARQFDRIADSETQHLEAWRTVLSDKGLSDPTAGDPLGEFDDPDLQAMYEDLVARGLTSLAEAAQVGIDIEQMDIVELSAALESADDPAVSKVLTDQLAASERHLAAFERLAGTGDGSSADNGEQGNGSQGKGRNGQGGAKGAQDQGRQAGGSENRGPHGDGTGDCDNGSSATGGQQQCFRFGAAT